MRLSFIFLLWCLAGCQLDLEHRATSPEAELTFHSANARIETKDAGVKSGPAFSYPGTTFAATLSGILIRGVKDEKGAFVEVGQPPVRFDLTQLPTTQIYPWPVTPADVPAR